MARGSRRRWRARGSADAFRFRAVRALGQESARRALPARRSSSLTVCRSNRGPALSRLSARRRRRLVSIEGVRHVVELLAKLLDARIVTVRIFGLELGLVGGLVAEIGD